MLQTGEPAPDFALSDPAGRRVSLSDLAGKHVILYFYPRDDTTGCTKEACSFRDNWQSITDLGAVVLGVSPDNAQSHQRFLEKYSLTFPLLSDTDHKVAEAYGAWGEKSFYGKKSVGVLRKTFVIDGNARVAKIFDKVKPEGHGEEVLAFLRTALGQGINSVRA